MSNTKPCIAKMQDKTVQATLKVSLNSDTNKVKELRDAIKANDGYCPCELHKTPDTKCMCKAFREQCEPGPCHCGLYIKEEINNG